MIDSKFIFISYSSKDKYVADALCHYLEEHNIPCWIAPRDILAGQSWAGAIVKAIRDCSAMVLIYSADSNTSHQVANEIDKAFSCAKIIIPFIVDSTPMNDDFDYYLSRKHWLIAYPDYKDKLKPLFDSLIKLVPDLQCGSTKEELPINAMRKETINHSNEIDVEDKPDNDKTNAGTAETETSPEFQQEMLKPHWADDVTDEAKQVVQQILSNMIYVEGGTFMMGATPEQEKWADNDEKPAHKVTLSSYYICKYLVTQKEWMTIMGKNPSKEVGEDKAVNYVSKVDCDEFVSLLKKWTGINFALPTEAQWEFAARGGNYSKGYVYSGGNDVDKVAWTWSWDSDDPNKVGVKEPNELGIYDMSGYLSEWCCEKKGKYTEDAVVNPNSIYKVHWLNEDSYVVRGGDYLSGKKKCRVSYRACWSQKNKDKTIGLRLIIANDCV